MKKIFFIILALLTLTSCYKIYTFDNKLEPAFFYDECIVCDTLIFNMNCQVNSDTVTIQFLKKEFTEKNLYILNVFEKELNIKKYDCIVLQEDLKYSSLAFKEVLKEKNKIPRKDSFWFYFTPNMGLTWYTFDKMYNKYKDE